MCRAGGRRCPSHRDPEQIAARNAKRRETYANKKMSSPKTLTGELTPTQAQYFASSKARDKNGNLVKIYHGSAYQFEAFDPATVGKGNDSWGNGFYFTDQETVAKGYANDTGSPTANVKEFYINLINPLTIDGKEHMSLQEVSFTPQQAANILKKHPTAYLQPDEEDSEGNTNFLGDFSSKFWDKTEHSKENFNQMIEQVAKEYFSYGGWVELENVYGREHGSLFLKAVHEETGYDGVIVDFGEEVGKHYVAWFPEQVKLVTNTNPTDIAAF